MAKVSMHPVPDDMEIAAGFKVSSWKALRLNDTASADWDLARTIFDTRMRRRFIDPADMLISHEAECERGTFGFAILAIDCLLVETMQGFREGLIDHTGQSKGLIKRFLVQRDEFRTFFPDGQGAENFYIRIRCALLHSGQTDGDFRVQRIGPLLMDNGNGRVDVNRSAFHQAVTRELEAYLVELAVPTNDVLRTNFRNKMNAICGLGPSTNAKSP